MGCHQIVQVAWKLNIEATRLPVPLPSPPILYVKMLHFITTFSFISDVSPRNPHLAFQFVGFYGVLIAYLFNKMENLSDRMEK